MNKNIDLVFSAPKGRDLARLASRAKRASGGKNYTNSKAPRQGFFKNVLETAAQELKLKSKIGVSVNLVGETKMRELNKKYRNKNKSTNILSFPLKEKLEIENWKLKIEKDIGDIFLCLSIAKKEAKRENVSIERKLAQLTAHGFLHLMGYDHEKSADSAREVFELEGRILDEIKRAHLKHKAQNTKHK